MVIPAKFPLSLMAPRHHMHCRSKRRNLVTVYSHVITQSIAALCLDGHHIT